MRISAGAAGSDLVMFHSREMAAARRFQRSRVEHAGHKIGLGTDSESMKAKRAYETRRAVPVDSAARHPEPEIPGALPWARRNREVVRSMLRIAYASFSFALFTTRAKSRWLLQAHEAAWTSMFDRSRDSGGKAANSSRAVL